MNTCSKCHEPKALSEYYQSNYSTCKECVKYAVRQRYEQKREVLSAYDKKRRQRPKRKADQLQSQANHRARHPDRYRARTAVSNAVRDGRLFRGPCIHCGSTVRVQAHHHDYSKPLDVTWVCFVCHREHEHGQQVTQREQRIDR